MAQITENYCHYKSTDIFDKTNVPKMFLHLHNTRAGVYGKICVLSGSLKFYGFSEKRGPVEQEIIIPSGEHGISPPEYWHKVEFLTDDTKFRVDFYADKNSDIVNNTLSERN
jgi:tellurite resistance-related uncharacterized protein